jgi:alanine racemase
MTRAWVEIDLGALLRNGARVVEHTGIAILPMVKADAYGLGATRVACALEALDPWGFGVATVGEGEELRRAGITRPILIFTPLLLEELDAVRRARITPGLGSAESIRRWALTGAPWHLAIDTGMNRAGVSWNEVGELRDALAAYPPQGVFTHFHSAELDDGSREQQEERFAKAIASLPTRPEVVHAENSPAVAHRGANYSLRWTLARPGVFLYGVGSGPTAAMQPDPVVSMRARVVDMRIVPDGETVSYDATYRAVGSRRIATLAIGYADGYRRALSNVGSVLVRGRRAPVAGLVTMDMTMIDVTDVPCEIGDVATLIGRDGDDQIDIEELASTGNLSAYEVLTGLRARLPRRYVDADVDTARASA